MADDEAELVGEGVADAVTSGTTDDEADGVPEGVTSTVGEVSATVVGTDDAVGSPTVWLSATARRSDELGAGLAPAVGPDDTLGEAEALGLAEELGVADGASLVDELADGVGVVVGEAVGVAVGEAEPVAVGLALEVDVGDTQSGTGDEESA